MMEMSTYSQNQRITTRNDYNCNIKPILVKLSGAKYNEMSKNLLLQQMPYAWFCKLTSTAWLWFYFDSSEVLWRAFMETSPVPQRCVCVCCSEVWARLEPLVHHFWQTNFMFDTCTANEISYLIYFNQSLTFSAYLMEGYHWKYSQDFFFFNHQQSLWGHIITSWTKTKSFWQTSVVQMPNVAGSECRVCCLHEAHIRNYFSNQAKYFSFWFLLFVSGIWSLEILYEQQSQNQEWNTEWVTFGLLQPEFYFSSLFFLVMIEGSICPPLDINKTSLLFKSGVAGSDLQGFSQWGEKISSDWTKIWQLLVNYVLGEIQSPWRNHSAFGKRAHLLSGGE